MGAGLGAGATLPEPERVSKWAAYGAIDGQALCTAERLGCTGAAICAREGGVGCRLRRKRRSTARTAPRRDHRAYRRCAGDTQRRRHGEHRPSQHAEEVNWRAGEAAKRAGALAERPAPEDTARTRDAHGMSPVTRNAVSGHTTGRRRGDVARFRDPHPVNEQPRFALGDPRLSSTSTPLRSRRHARHPRHPGTRRRRITPVSVRESRDRQICYNCTCSVGKGGDCRGTKPRVNKRRWARTGRACDERVRTGETGKAYVAGLRSRGQSCG